MTVQTGKKLYPERISAGVGRDVYRITGSVYKFTDEELINACDCNNWGGVVYQRTEFYAEVIVYTD